jgi:hypothetical protein
VVKLFTGAYSSSMIRLDSKSNKFVEVMEMSFNKEMILKYIDTYKENYEKQHGELPTSWFSYFRWLGSFTPANSFNNEETELAKQLLGVK